MHPYFLAMLLKVTLGLNISHMICEKLNALFRTVKNM